MDESNVGGPTWPGVSGQELMRRVQEGAAQKLTVHHTSLGFLPRATLPESPFR